VGQHIRRQTLLSSLAKAMVKLKCVEFKAIGLPDYLDDECTRPRVGPEFSCPLIDEDEDAAEDDNVIPHQKRK
jgi:hypothetical protein